MPANERLRRLRTARNWSQQDVADQVGVALITMHRWERGSQHPSAYYRVKLCALFGVSAQELGFLEALSPLIPQDTEASTAAPPDATPPEELALWTVPYARNPHFTGRDELLSQLERKIAPRVKGLPTAIQHAALTQSQAIKGLGGIGKTQTAIEYAYRAREQGRYTHTLWINSASEEAIIASFVALTDRVPALGEKEESDQRALVNKVLRWLEHRPEPWLLIYDNADEITFLPPYLPIQGRGSILFTTRASAVGALAPSLEVDALPLEEGVQLLLRRAGRAGEITEQEREEASAIVLALGRFPLALDQAGAYMEETGCSLQDYLQLYQQHQYALLARRGKQAGSYPDSVATTWSLAFEQIARTDPAAVELLRLCAFLAPDQIPEELLTQGVVCWPPALQEAATDRFRFNQMLSTLLAFSLIKRVGREHQLSLHRLVQAVQRARMTPEEQRQWAERVVRAVNRVFPPDPEYQVVSWPLCQRYLQQAQMCDTLIQQYRVLLPEAADILHRTGIYLRGHALYAQAEPLLQRALTLREYLLGPEHPEVAQLMNTLASLYAYQGKYARAEPLFRRALSIREQQLGPEHPSVAQSLNDLAALYVLQDKHAPAESFLQRALHIQEQQVGAEHPEVAQLTNNLAVLYIQQGKYAPAEPLFRRALSIREQQLGPEDPSVAQILNNLGTLYLKQGDYAQAEPLLLRALRIWEERLGPEHPSVAFSLNNLALLYSQQGKFAQAESLYQRALRIREQQLGPEHLETAIVLHDFAGFQQAQGRTQEAAVLYQRALTTREHILGPDHPLTLDTHARLQEVLVALGKTTETAPTEA